MAGVYTLALLRSGPRAEWSRLLPFASDAEAIAAARRIAEAEGRRAPEGVSLMVGRSWDDGQVAWIGGWDRSSEGELDWDPLSPSTEDSSLKGAAPS